MMMMMMMTDAMGDDDDQDDDEDAKTEMPQSSPPLWVGDEGRPMANPPQMQTEGPAKMRKTSKRGHPRFPTIQKKMMKMMVMMMAMLM